MSDALFLFSALILNFIGMRWLSLSFPFHWQQVFGEKGLSKKNKIVFRVLAVCMFSLSLTLTLLADHATISVLVWIMSLTFSAFLIAMLLSFKANFLRII